MEIWISSTTTSSNGRVAKTCVGARATLARAHVARIGYEVGVAAALCWLALGVESIVRRHQVLDAFWVASALLTAVTFWCLHFVQSCQDQEWEEISHLIWQISCVLTILTNIELVTGDIALSASRFPCGGVLWTVTLVAFGMGTWKAAVFPRYVAVAIMLLEPASILTQLALSPIAPLQTRGAYSGAVDTALGMALIAIGLRNVAKRLHRESFDMTAEEFWPQPHNAVISTSPRRAAGASGWREPAIPREAG